MSSQPYTHANSYSLAPDSPVMLDADDNEPRYSPTSPLNTPTAPSDGPLSPRYSPVGFGYEPVGPSRSGHVRSSGSLNQHGLIAPVTADAQQLSARGQRVLMVHGAQSLDLQSGLPLLTVTASQNGRDYAMHLEQMNSFNHARTMHAEILDYVHIQDGNSSGCRLLFTDAAYRDCRSCRKHANCLGIAEGTTSLNVVDYLARLSKFTQNLPTWRDGLFDMPETNAYLADGLPATFQFPRLVLDLPLYVEDECRRILARKHDITAGLIHWLAQYRIKAEADAEKMETLRTKVGRDLNKASFIIDEERKRVADSSERLNDMFSVIEASLMKQGELLERANRLAARQDGLGRMRRW